MTVKEAAEEFIVYISSVRSLSQNTVTAYKNDLLVFESMPSIGPEKPVELVAADDIRLCIGVLSRKKFEASSINRFIASVRGLFGYCRKFNYIQKNPALEIKTVKLPKRLPNFLTGAEVDKLCSEPHKNELLWEKRDSAILEFMYSSGCRVSEVASLKVCDLSADLSCAIVTGKGNKDRKVYLEDDARKAVGEYIADRNARFADNKVHNPKNYLFVNQNGTPITVRGIRYIIDRYSGADGTGHHVNPHALRHTFATGMIASGADVRLVQELLGHSSISTTQRYTHITTDKMIEMYNRAHPHGGRE